MNTKACKHLEKLLPSPNAGQIGRVRVDNIKALGVQSNSLKEGAFEDSAARLERALFAAGIETFRIELLMDRFVSRLSLTEIAKNRGYVSGSAVQYLVNDTLKILKSYGHVFTKKLLGDYE